jgi:hypothetical protein
MRTAFLRAQKMHKKNYVVVRSDVCKCSPNRILRNFLLWQAVRKMAGR